MPQFFELRGERASTHYGMFGIHLVQAVIDHRFPQPIPLHGGIARGVLGIQHVPVLDEQQRSDHERRNARIAGIDSARADRTSTYRARRDRRFAIRLDPSGDRPDTAQCPKATPAAPSCEPARRYDSRWPSGAAERRECAHSQASSRKDQSPDSEWTRFCLPPVGKRDGGRLRERRSIRSRSFSAQTRRL